jgi:hypothetical protein
MQLGTGRFSKANRAKAAASMASVFGALQLGLLEPARHNRVQEQNVMARGDKRGVEFLPVVAGRLHHHERRWRPQRLKLHAVAASILVTFDRAAQRLSRPVPPRQHMAFGGNINPGKHPFLPCSDRGASKPTPTLSLAQVETLSRLSQPHHSKGDVR